MRAEDEHFIDDDEWRDQIVPPRDSDGEWEAIAPGVQRLRFADNDPTRQIVTGRRNMKVGGFFSYKMGCHVEHEGDHEGMLAALFEVHSLIEAFWGQPESLKIQLDGDIIRDTGETSSMIYTTDFLAIISSWAVRAEFKLLSDIRPPTPKSPDDHRGWGKWEDAKKMRRRLRIARQAYRDAGLIWVLITDADLRAMAKSQTIGEIVACGGTDIDEEDKARLIDALQQSPRQCLALRDCESLIKASSFPRGAILARIPERLVHVDLMEDITVDSLVFLTGADHG